MQAGELSPFLCNRELAKTLGLLYQPILFGCAWRPKSLNKGLCRLFEIAELLFH